MAFFFILSFFALPVCVAGEMMPMFWVAPRFGPEGLKAIFEHNVFRMLLSKGKITPDLITLLRSWRHSGFQVYVGQPNGYDF